MNQDLVVRTVLAQAIKKCPKSRTQIAEEMSAAMGIRFTEAMLNAYTSESHDRYRWPLAWTCSFCKVTGDHRLLTIVADCLGLTICSEEDQMLLELGREYLRRKEADQQISVLESKIARRGKE